MESGVIGKLVDARLIPARIAQVLNMSRNILHAGEPDVTGGQHFIDHLLDTQPA